jgi:hypothetical protein
VYHWWKSVERLKIYSTGEFLKALIPCSPRLKAWKILMILFSFPCFAESIGVLLVKISQTIEKLFKRGVFDKNCSLATLDWNFQIFDDLILFCLFCWIVRYITCENRSNGWKVIQEGSCWKKLLPYDVIEAASRIKFGKHDGHFGLSTDHVKHAFFIGSQPIELVEQWPHLGHIITQDCNDSEDVLFRPSLIGLRAPY